VMVLTERDMWTMPIAITTLRIQATGSALNEGAELQMAGATLAVIPIMVAFVIFQRSIVQSVAMSGIKG
jgi:multiple sugar transport system permease protein